MQTGCGSWLGHRKDSSGCHGQLARSTDLITLSNEVRSAEQHANKFEFDLVANREPLNVESHECSATDEDTYNNPKS